MFWEEVLTGPIVCDIVTVLYYTSVGRGGFGHAGDALGN